MQPDNRLQRVISIGFSLALATAPAFVLSGCGDDDDDDDGTSGRDGGTSGRGGSGGRGGTGGSSGRGGTGGSSGRGGSGGQAGEAGSTAGTSGGGGAAGDEDAGMEPPADMLRDIAVEMTMMEPHMGDMMQFRVVSAGDELVALGVLDTLQTASYTFALPGSTPEGDHRMDFWADLNGNGNYNMPPADHAWRIDIPDGDATLAFEHNTDFTDIDTPAVTEGDDFTFMATDMTPHLNQLFELRVIEADGGRLVGRYVLSAVPAANFQIELPGIIQPNTMYQIDFTADLNDDGNYDAPPTDHAWREMATSDNNGLDVSFAHGTDFTDVMF